MNKIKLFVIIGIFVLLPCSAVALAQWNGNDYYYHNSYSYDNFGDTISKTASGVVYEGHYNYVAFTRKMKTRLNVDKNGVYMYVECKSITKDGNVDRDIDDCTSSWYKKTLHADEYAPVKEIEELFFYAEGSKSTTQVTYTWLLD